MGLGREIRVVFLGDNSDLSRASAGASRDVGRLGSNLKKVGALAAVGLGVGLAVGARALVGMTKAAIEDDKAQTILANTLRNAAGATDGQIASTEKWISAQGRALGVADDDLRPAIQRLAEATGSVTKAQSLASLAMDISAGTGKSLKSVSEALAKAQMGQVGALSRYGIRTRDASGELMSFEGVVKSASATFAGQASSSANTLEGKMGRLRLVFDEAKETVGAKLIPALTRFSEWVLSDGVPMAESFGEKMAQAGQVLGRVAGFVDRNRTAFATLAGVVLALVVVTKVHAAVMAIQAVGLMGLARGTKLYAAAARTAAAVQWLLNAAMSANPIGIVIAILVALAVAVVIAYKRSSTFREIVQKAWAVVKSGASAMWGVLKGVFSAFVGALKAVGNAGIWLWNRALAPAFRAIAGGIAKLLGTWAGMLRALGKVPGFGWATTAAGKMQSAANAAGNVAANIRNIKSKSVTVTIRTNHINTTTTLTKLGFIGRNAGGTDNWRGGPTWVGEEGPEILDLPSGSRITPHRRSMARAGGGGRDIHVHFHGINTDPRAAAREIARLLREEKLLSGRELGIS